VLDWVNSLLQAGKDNDSAYSLGGRVEAAVVSCVLGRIQTGREFGGRKVR